MKKMLFILVALLIASPAMADVDITATADVNGNSAEITISYAVTAGEDIRAIAVDITLVGDACVVAVDCVNGDFTIYPGSINIAGDGSVSDDGSCLCDAGYAGTQAGLETDGVTLEMGSLYEIGVEDPPADSNVLAVLTIEGFDDVNVCVALNAIRGGVVLEDPDEAVTVNLDCVTAGLDAPAPTDCMMASHPDHAMWLTRGKPDCWCNRRQCKGDIDGLMEGPIPVSLNDLIAFRTFFNIPITAVPAGFECADFDAANEGPIPVSLNDLVIFRVSFNLPATAVLECDGTHINFWNN